MKLRVQALTIAGIALAVLLGFVFARPFGGDRPPPIAGEPPAGRPDPSTMRADPPAEPARRELVAPAPALGASLVVQVTEEGGLPVAGASLTRLTAEELSQRMARGAPLGTTDDRGTAAVSLATGPAWPWHVLVFAAGFYPETRTVHDGGPHRFVLRRGLTLEVEVAFRDGTPAVGCPLIASTSPLPAHSESLPWIASASIGMPTDGRTRVHRATTDDAGVTRLSGLWPGMVHLSVLPLELLLRRQEPLPARVPDHDHVRITVDHTYVAALRTPGDRVLDYFGRIYDGTKVDTVFGERLSLLQRIGRDRLDGGLCIVLAKKLTLSEAEFLSWEVTGEAMLEKRGRLPFRVRPIRFSELDRAPVWEFPVEARAGRFGEVAATAMEPDQSEVVGAIGDELVRLTGVSGDCEGQTAVVKGDRAARLLAGRYRCEDGWGTFRDRIDHPAEVVVVAGQRTEVPVRLREIMAPVRVRVVDASGTSYRGGTWEFSYPESGKRFWGLAPGAYEDVTHWLPAGRVTVHARPALSATALSRDFEIPFQWTTEPLEIYLEHR